MPVLQPSGTANINGCYWCWWQSVSLFYHIYSFTGEVTTFHFLPLTQITSSNWSLVDNTERWVRTHIKTKSSLTLSETLVLFCFFGLFPFWKWRKKRKRKSTNIDLSVCSEEWRLCRYMLTRHFGFFTLTNTLSATLSTAIHLSVCKLPADWGGWQRPKETDFMGFVLYTAVYWQDV